MASLPESTTILIVGAGPAGLACAISLAVNNVAVVVVDALPAGLNGSRAGIVHAYTLEQLDSVGSAAELVAFGIQARWVEVCDEWDRPLAQLNFGSLEGSTKFPMGLLIGQHDVERMLEVRVKSLGVQLFRNERVVDMCPDPAGLKVVMESGKTVKSKYVVGADGSKSKIRSLAGIAYLDPHTGKESVASENSVSLSLADILIHDPLPATLSRAHGAGRIGDGGIALLVPLPNSAAVPGDKTSENLFRFVATLGPADPPAMPTPDVAYIQALLNRRGPGSHTGGPVPQVAAVLNGSRYRVRSALADAFLKRVGDGYVLLAGDAAHAHSPAGGQGMNLGLCDGVILGKALAVHMSVGGADDAVLEKYASTRHQVAREVIAFAERMTTMARIDGAWTKPLRNFLVRMVTSIPGVRSQMAWTASGLKYRE